MEALRRISITVDKDLSKQLADIKKNYFFDKSHADMYRFLLALGAKEATKKGNK